MIYKREVPDRPDEEGYGIWEFCRRWEEDMNAVGATVRDLLPMDGDPWQDFKMLLEEGYKLYFDEVMAIPPLEEPEESQLISRLSPDDPEPGRRLVESRLLLAAYIARGYAERSITFGDILQAANLGLIQAMENYDPEVGGLLPQMVWWIRSNILRTTKETHESTIYEVSLPRGKRMQILVGRFLAEKNGENDPCLERLALYSGLTVPQLVEYYRANHFTAYMEDPLGVIGFLCMRDYLPVGVWQGQEPGEDICDMLAKADTTARQVMMLHYGLADGRAMPLSEVCRKTGVTEKEARETEANGLRQLLRIRKEKASAPAEGRE